MDNTFVLNSLTAHRFLLASMVVASKGLCDHYLASSDYARLGGVNTREIHRLECELLRRVDWGIVVNPDILGEYYDMVVARSRLPRTGGGSTA